jgi:hypothetical protein
MADQQSLDPKLNSAWSCNLTNQEGGEVLLNPSVMQLSIFESIYNNSIFGNIMVQDNMGLLEKFAMLGSGKESVTINIETPNPPHDESYFNKKMIINSLQDVARIGDGTGQTQYVLGFVSPYLVKNNVSRMSRSFDAMTTTDIVDYVSRDIMKFGTETNTGFTSLVTNTPSKNPKHIVVPNWKPFELFNFLARNSVSANGQSNYIFFENSEGFHFTTIDELKKAEPIRMLHATEIPLNMVETGVGSNIIVSNKTEDFTEIERFNTSKAIVGGMYGGKVITHNILTKEIETYEIKTTEEGSDLGSVNFGEVFDSDFVSDSNLGYMSSNYLYGYHDKSEIPHYPRYDQKMMEIRTNNVKFDVPGDSNIFAGNVIEIIIPSQTDQSGESDPYISGKFLVTAIHHKINNNEYTMTLECNKDGFDSEVSGDAKKFMGAI